MRPPLKDGRRVRQVIALSAIVFASVGQTHTASGAEAKSGARCTKPGAVSKTRTRSLRCVTQNGKLVWVVVPTTTTVPSAGARGRRSGLVAPKSGDNRLQSFDLTKVRTSPSGLPENDVPLKILDPLGLLGSWAPTGDRVAYYRFTEKGAAELWIIDAGGTQPTQFPGLSALRLGGRPSWSPDGKFLSAALQTGTAYRPGTDRTQSDILIIDVATGEIRRVPHPAPDFFVRGVSSSPVGDRLAIFGTVGACQPGEACAPRFATKVFFVDPLSPDKPPVDAVNLDGWAVDELAWSPAGDLVAFTSGDNKNPGFKTFVADLSGNFLTSETMRQRFPRYSPRQWSDILLYWGQRCSLWARGGCLE